MYGNQNFGYGGYNPGGAPGGQAPGGYPPGGQAPGGYPPGGQASGGYPPGGQAPGGYPPGGQAPGGYPPGGQAPGGYTPGGQAPGGYAPGGPPGVSPDVQQWFNSVDKDRSGEINWEELQCALINGQGKNFSDSACKLMVGMFDQDKTGTININEFQQLFAYINQWLAVFRNYDRDQSGHIEELELAQALQQMGFKFSPDFVKFLIAKSDVQNHKMMSVDQFIVLCVQIQRFTEAFRMRDKEMKGVITIAFEDFLSVAINCTT